MKEGHDLNTRFLDNINVSFENYYIVIVSTTMEQMIQKKQKNMIVNWRKTMKYVVVGGKGLSVIS